MWFFRRGAESSEGNKNRNESAAGSAEHHPEKPNRCDELTTPKQRVMEHPDWAFDRMTSGSFPESTQLATVRQLARVIGDILGRETPSIEGGYVTLQTYLREPMVPKESDALLYATVSTISSSHHMDDATEKLRHLFARATETTTLVEKLNLVTGLAHGAYSRMMDNLLVKPAEGYEAFSGDGSVHSAFGADGGLERVSIKMARGHFSFFLERRIVAAADRFTKRQESRDGETPHPDERGVCVKLRIDSGTSTHLLSSNDLRDAYFTAMMDYSAIGYASRIRELLKRTPSIGHPDISVFGDNPRGQ